MKIKKKVTGRKLHKRFLIGLLYGHNESISLIKKIDKEQMVIAHGKNKPHTSDLFPNLTYLEEIIAS